MRGSLSIPITPLTLLLLRRRRDFSVGRLMGTWFDLGPTLLYWVNAFSFPSFGFNISKYLTPFITFKLPYFFSFSLIEKKGKFYDVLLTYFIMVFIHFLYIFSTISVYIGISVRFYTVLSSKSCPFINYCYFVFFCLVLHPAF